MYSIFTRILNMSLTAGIIVIAVLLIRLLFRGCPKKYICILWALVAVRLMTPVTFSSSFSVYNLLPEPVRTEGQVQYFHYSETPEKPGVEFQTQGLYTEKTDVGNSEYRVDDPYLPPLMMLWTAGMLAMLGYAVISEYRIKKSVEAAVSMGGNRYCCDEAESPFILGVLRPRIYLPSGLDPAVQKCVLEHEDAHIRRKDHWWKPLGFLLLSVYWFNPLLWIGYAVLCRDIETACDEAVLQQMDPRQKTEYSEALLQCAIRRRGISACPVAFGETDVKNRVKHILNYRKPAFWIVIMGIAVCIAAAVCLLTDPKKDIDPEETAAIGTAKETAADSETDTKAPHISMIETGSTGEGDQAEEPKALGEELIQVCADFMSQFMIGLKGDSERITRPEDAVSPENYLAYRYLEMRREYFRQEYGEGITDLEIGISIDESAAYRLTGLDLDEKMIPVTVMASYQCDSSCRFSEDFFYILTVRNQEAAYEVTNIVMADTYVDYLTRHTVPCVIISMAEENGAEDLYAYIDQTLTGIYENCGDGDISRLEVMKPMDSDYLTQDDFQSAVDAVKVHFQACMNGCSLMLLGYPGDEEASHWECASAWKENQTMILRGNWETGPEGTVSTAMNPNSVYDNRTFILRRNGAGGWNVVDEGY